MKLVLAKDAKVFPNSAGCTAIEYPLGDRDINVAVIKLSGRYPDKGWAVNEKCKEAAYAVSGSGKLFVGEKVVELNSGDVVLIEAGEKYYWEGNLELVVPCAPAWYPEQHKLI
jgi:mannose-6-phosphate isomerase-like protein (cupin superfamily)